MEHGNFMVYCEAHAFASTYSETIRNAVAAAYYAVIDCDLPTEWDKKRTSVRDALVTLGYGKFESEQACNLIDSAFELSKHYENNQFYGCKGCDA